MAKHGKAWQGDVKGRNSVLDTDRQTQGQVQVLSCTFAAKNNKLQRNIYQKWMRSFLKGILWFGLFLVACLDLVYKHWTLRNLKITLFIVKYNTQALPTWCIASHNLSCIHKGKRMVWSLEVWDTELKPTHLLYLPHDLQSIVCQNQPLFGSCRNHSMSLCRVWVCHKNSLQFVKKSMSRNAEIGTQFGKSWNWQVLIQVLNRKSPKVKSKVGISKFSTWVVHWNRPAY